jgi:hypothetical protein
MVFYVGMTFRTLEDESLRWLTERGANRMWMHPRYSAETARKKEEENRMKKKNQRQKKNRMILKTVRARVRRR